MYRQSNSSLKSLHAGVPQGSVLGPLLFLIYVNDVADNMLTFCRLFADDNSIHYSSEKIDVIERNINRDLAELDKWSKKWLLNFNPQKTKAVCFSTKKSSERPSLTFQNCQIEFVSFHKHLGIIFSENLNWRTYIDNIISTAYKKLNLMKKFKFKLNRKALSIMYTSFIRPHLEYASDVWGGCSLSNAEKLEQVQLLAARIVSGLPIFASKTSLYYETGWIPLFSRRKIARLKTMYKVDKNIIPSYIRDIFPDKRGKASSYTTKNSQNYSLPKCRLQLYKTSFVPTVISEWNTLPQEIRDAPSLKTFSQKIISHVNEINNNHPPEYFSHGDRTLNILHTKLRHNCILNCDLHRYNIIDSPLCTCGKIEDTYHYFFSCVKYARARDELFNNVFNICNLNIVNTHVLLWGDTSITDKDNEHLFSLIHIYIKKSKRFNIHL